MVRIIEGFNRHLYGIEALTMFHRYLKSTLGNINLINSLRKDETENVSQEKTVHKLMVWVSGINVL